MTLSRNAYRPAAAVLMLAAALIVLLAVSGCGTKPPAKPDKVYTVAHRQLPPPPVYNRLREVRFPDALPSRELGGTRARLEPLVHFTMSKAPLDEAARKLAAAVRYRSYCASTIAGQQLTINKLGSVDEIAEAIAASAGIRIIIDHENRAISFLARESLEPRFYEGS